MRLQPLISTIALCVTATALAADPPRRFRDPFVDGTTRQGPPLIRVAPLAFDMGSRPEDPGYGPMQRRHRVALGAYAIGQLEVTNEEFSEFLDDEGTVELDGVPAIAIGSPHCGIVRRGSTFVARDGYARKPVVTVSWQGARAYCRWLSRRTGWRYDLPSAAQWEAAARAGTTTAWPWGDHDDPRRYRARATTVVDVGTFPPNRWGLHDTSGNVWEWVLDCFAPDFFLLSPMRDPVLLDERCFTPEIRGGSFRDGGEFARPGYRADYWWRGNDDSIGFRVARAMPSAAVPSAARRSDPRRRRSTR